MMLILLAVRVVAEVIGAARLGLLAHAAAGIGDPARDRIRDTIITGRSVCARLSGSALTLRPASRLLGQEVSGVNIR